MWKRKVDQKKKKKSFKLVGWCWSPQESEDIDFVGIFFFFFFSLRWNLAAALPTEVRWAEERDRVTLP